MGFRYATGRLGYKKAVVSAVNPGTTNLVSWWTLDETSGTSVADSHGSNTGTASGASVNANGIQNYCRNFDGDNDYVNVPSDASLQVQRPTLVFWAKHDSPADSLNGGVAYGRMFGGTNQFSYKINFHEGNALGRISTSTESHTDISIAIGDTDWHMWALTYDGTNVNMSKDGGAFETESFASKTIAYGYGYYNYFRMGARDAGQYSIDGFIDEVSVWNVALSIENLQWLYNSGSGRTYTDL